MKEYKYLTEINNQYTISIPEKILNQLTLTDKLHISIKVKEDKQWLKLNK